MTSLPITKEIPHPTGGGEFFYGRSEEIIHRYLEKYSGQVQVIYLDPPFCTGGNFSFQTSNYAQPAYTDNLPLDAYLQMMRLILSGCFNLLHQEGCLYLHIDYRVSAQMRILMDEIFGMNNFMNEIIWAYQSGGRSTKHFPRKHDNILLYRKSRHCYFHISAVGKPRGAERKNHMKRSLDEAGRVVYSIRSGNKEYTYTEDQLVYPSDIWTDISHLHQRDPQRNGYATQKPEALLERIVLASSRPGDIIADFFSGSGTTAAVARKAERYFIGADSSPYALYTLRRRIADDLSLKRFVLHFPASQFQCELDYEKSRNTYETVIKLNSAQSLQNNCAFLGCSGGYMQDDAFYPLQYIDKPVFPISFSVPIPHIPVVLLTDSMGNQGFYLL